MNDKTNSICRRRQLSRRLWCVLTSLLMITGAGIASANPTGFSGQATVVRANVLGIETVLVDTGPLPEEGGAASETLLEYPIPGLADPLNGALQAEVLHAATVGQGNQSRSEASVAEMSLSLGGHTISAALLQARATARCQGGQASVSGSSEIASLVVNGTPIVVSGAPNQTVEVGTLRIVINEQQVFTEGGIGDITVNALHVTVRNPLDNSVVADVVISSAHADIHCAGPPPVGKDFVTGGGWIIGASGSKANFAIAGGIKKNNALWGHLTYLDHGLRLKVKGSGVTAYFITGPTSRRIEGTCMINGAAGSYEVDVSDNGEPGRDDTFTIRLSNGYTASGNLQGGNIQLHTP